MVRLGLDRASSVSAWLNFAGNQIQFYRQKPIGCVIVDFYAPAVRLVVELDGSQHHDQAQAAEDVRRDAMLAELGIAVLRIDNRSALTETDIVIETIFRACCERETHTSAEQGVKVWRRPA